MGLSCNTSPPPPPRKKHVTTTTTTTKTTRTLLGILAISATAALLSGCGVIQQFIGGGDATRDETGEVIEGTDTGDVFLLQVGDCINDSELDEVVTTLPIVPCDEPHDSEVYSEATLVGDAYPGDDVVGTQADEACYGAFAAFVGLDYESSVLEYYPFTPVAEGWAQGDRVVSCVIYDPATQTTGTLEGAAR